MQEFDHSNIEDANIDETLVVANDAMTIGCLGVEDAASSSYESTRTVGDSTTTPIVKTPLDELAAAAQPPPPPTSSSRATSVSAIDSMRRGAACLQQIRRIYGQYENDIEGEY